MPAVITFPVMISLLTLICYLFIWSLVSPTIAHIPPSFLRKVPKRILHINRPWFMSESCLWKSGHKPKLFIHLVVWLKTGPKPLPKKALHSLQSIAFSFKREYPLLSLRSSSSFLHLLPCLPVTFIPPFIFPSVTCFTRQFLHNTKCDQSS